MNTHAYHAPAGGPGMQVRQYGTYERVAIEKMYGAKVKGALIPNLVREGLSRTAIHLTNVRKGFEVRAIPSHLLLGCQARLRELECNSDAQAATGLPRSACTR